MSKLREYLLNGGSIAELSETHLVKHRRHCDYPNLVLFTYNIGCKFDQPFHSECRGIILDEANNWEIVSRPYDKFWNLGESKADEIDWNTAVVQEKLDGCFPHQQKIQLWDGSSVSIGKLVNSKISATVVGLNNEGKIVPSKIIGWKNNGRKTNWLEIEVGKLQPYGKMILSGKIKVTTNHHIYLNGKYVAASSLKINDKLITYQKKPDNTILHLIKSSLLGDGSLPQSKDKSKQVFFQENHKQEHESYCDLLKSSLGDYFLSKENKISGYGSKMISIRSKSDVYLRKLREEWYPNGIKQLPEDLSWIDDFTIAKWYCDDGGLNHSEYQNDRATFSTNSFSEEDVDRLSSLLENKYNISCTVFFSKGWCLRINAGDDNSIETFWKSISPYVPLCMRYKLPERYRNDIFVGWDIGKIEIIPSEVEIKSIKLLDINKKNFPSGSTGYDIQTETGNYFSGGVLVHNSMIQAYKYNGHWNIATSGTPDANVPVNDFSFTFKELFNRALEENNLQLPDLPNGFTLLFELCSEYNQIVVPHKGLKVYFIDCRCNDGMYLGHTIECMKDFPKPKIFDIKNIEELLNSLNSFKGIDREGYVVKDANDRRIKIKHPEYVTLHHAATGTTFTALVLLALKGESSEAIAYFPHLTESLNKLSSTIDNQCFLIQHLYESIKDIPERKAFALEAVKSPYKAVLFTMKDKNLSPREVLLNMRIDNVIDLLNLRNI